MTRSTSSTPPASAPTNRATPSWVDPDPAERTMTPIVPRWEWRTFGDQFGDVDDSLGTPSRDIEESRELYLLSATGENVKVRGDLLDVKVLREVDNLGLQRWEPVVKAPFPLVPADVAAAFDGLHQPVPNLGREMYTLDQFVAELIAPSAEVR